MLDIPNEQKNTVYKVLTVFLVVLTLHVLVGIFTPRHHGWENGNESKIITLTGHGEIQAVPNIANVYFTITKDAKTVKEAQSLVADIEEKALDVLKTNGVAEKDFKTANASFSPKYEYKYDAKTYSPCTAYGCPPRQGNSVIVGYTAYESITVKIRNTDDAGKIMQGLGEVGVGELSGPNFAIDDEDALKAQARKEAIDDAKMKAKVLAKDLGVKLGDVTSFNESGNYGMPMYAKTMMAQDSAGTPAPAQLPKGENTISSDVTITYEIR